MRGFVFCYTAASLIKVVIIMLIFEGKEIETDTEGYLKESSQWSEPLAVVIAENEGISLSPEHWEVVQVVCTCERFKTPGCQSTACCPAALRPGPPGCRGRRGRWRVAGRCGGAR